MALFKRADLKDKGFSDDQIEYIMTESGRSLSANYILQSDVQTRIDEAVKAAQPAPVDVKASPEYAEVVRERDMLRAIGGEDFQTVKPKFREQVFNMLESGEGAKPVSEQLTESGRNTMSISSRRISRTSRSQPLEALIRAGCRKAKKVRLRLFPRRGVTPNN